jgi:hypothetical protein
MILDVFWRAAPAVRGTPLGAVARGGAGGLAGALLLSVLSRIPRALSGGGEPNRSGQPPVAPDPLLARALAIAQSPGPEGLAEQFAFKAASGLFGRDIAPYARPAGRAVHLAYGAVWGTLYGILQSSYRRPPVPFGAVYGLLVWLVGPAFLVPAMRLIGRPSEEPAARTAALIAGHVSYGLALAATFEALRRDAR